MTTHETSAQSGEQQLKRDEDLTSFYEKVLSPFEDSDLFKRQLFAESAYLRKNPGLRKDIGELILTENDQSLVDMIELLDLSRQLDAPVKQTPFRALMAQLTLSREIDDIKVGVVGEDSSATYSNALMNLAGRKLVDSIPNDEIYKYAMTADFIGAQVEARTDLPLLAKRWFKVKCGNVATLIEQKSYLIEYFEDMPKKDSETFSAEQIALDSEEIALLFKKAAENQRYGVKIGYKSQDYRPGSLVFSPMPDLNSELHEANRAHPLMISKGRRYPVALVADSTKSTFKKKIAYVNTDMGPGRVRGSLNVEGTREMFSLLDNGELTTFHTDLDMAQIAASNGAYSAYRHIQAEIMAGYIDLTCDLSVGQISHTIRVPKASEVDYREQSGIDIVKKLLIPRAKPVTPESETESLNVREVRLHGVVWHIRRLPEGWHASPEALQLASEAHISLADGETFVRSHSRGSKALGEVVLHNFAHPRH